MRHIALLAKVSPLFLSAALFTACNGEVTLGDLPQDGGSNGPDTGTPPRTPLPEPPDAGTDAPFNPWDAALPPSSGICGGNDAGLDDAAACGCTRRGPPNVQCPRGTGLIASAVIGPGGGKVQGDMGGGAPTSIAFPAGSLSAPTTVTIIETTDPPPHDLLDWSPVFLVEPVGLTFTFPPTVTFPWENTSGPVPSGLELWYSPDGACFSPVPYQYLNAGYITAQVTTLGGYYITGAARSPSTATCE